MKDELGDRMKSFYEDRYRFYLTRRTPVIIRLDGCAFHTFTRGLDKPFDLDFISIMQKTALNLCESIQNCVGAYVQSDEISLLLVDYNTLSTDAWFDYNLQKITSVAAAKATLAFNLNLEHVHDEIIETARYLNQHCKDEYEEEVNCYRKANLLADKFGRAYFDARAFNLPKEEVCNYFIWRQKDATRNSINAAGQAHFTAKELKDKSLADVQDMLHQIGINWNNYAPAEKRGSFIRRQKSIIVNAFAPNEEVYSWYIDHNMPILTEDRAYIEKLVYVGDE